MIMSKKELLDFLRSKLNYFINEEPNPFVEAQMVSTISNVINKIESFNCSDNQLLELYETSDNNADVKIVK